MTRTDVMASSRPQTAGAANTRTSRAARRLMVLPVVLLGMALLAPGSAFAASETSSGYNQEPNKPSTGTSPSKETTTPATTPSTTPSSEATPTTTTPTTTKALPFTGLDLRWSFGLGLLLMGAGFSIVVVQRRQRRDGAR
jgi:hypothetical protein